MPPKRRGRPPKQPAENEPDIINESAKPPAPSSVPAAKSKQTKSLAAKPSAKKAPRRRAVSVESLSSADAESIVSSSSSTDDVVEPPQRRPPRNEAVEAVKAPARRPRKADAAAAPPKKAEKPSAASPATASGEPRKVSILDSLSSASLTKRSSTLAPAASSSSVVSQVVVDDSPNDRPPKPDAASPAVPAAPQQKPKTPAFNFFKLGGRASGGSDDPSGSGRSPTAASSPKLLPPASSEKINRLTQAIASVPGTAIEGVPALCRTPITLAEEDSGDAVFARTKRNGEDRMRSYIEGAARYDPFKAALSSPAVASDSNDVHVIDPQFDDDAGGVIIQSHASTIEPTQEGAKLLVAAWRAVDPQRPLNQLPHLSCALAYAQEYLETARAVATNKQLAHLSWHTKHHVPAFPGTEVAVAFKRLTNWVQSWNKKDDADTTGNKNDDASSTDDSDDEIDLRLPHARGGAQRGNRTPPVTRGYIPSAPQTPQFDETGTRVSRRRREQLERERLIEAASMVGVKGYFDAGSSTTNGLGHRLSTTTNIAVLSGDHGVGKTNLVQQVADATQSYIVDVHTGINRSGANLEKLFREATQARRLGATKQSEESQLTRVSEMLAKLEQTAKATEERKVREQEAARIAAAAKAKGKMKSAGKMTQATVKNFFAPKRKAADQVAPAATSETVSSSDSDDGAVEAICPVKEAPPQAPTGESGPRNPLILVDSGDVTFDDEPGFAAALRKIARESKCPVIVTVNATLDPTELQSLYGSPHVPQCRINSPPAFMVVFYLLVVLRVEAADLAERVSVDDLVLFVRNRPGRRSSDLRAVLCDLEWLAKSSASFTRDRVAAPSEPPQIGGLPLSSWGEGELQRQLPRLDAADQHRIVLRDATTRAQLVHYFAELSAASAVNPSVQDGEGEVGMEAEALEKALADAWTRYPLDRHEDDWNQHRDLTLHDGQVLSHQAVACGAPREAVDRGGWSLGIGDAIERFDDLFEFVKREYPKRATKFFLHRTASSAALADFARMKRTPLILDHTE